MKGTRSNRSLRLAPETRNSSGATGSFRDLRFEVLSAHSSQVAEIAVDIIRFMKRLTSTSVLLIFFLTAMLRVAAQSPTLAPCKVGVQAPAFGFWNWKSQSTVRVYVVTGDFRDDELPYLLVPIENWSAVSEATGSGVKFTYAGTTAAPLDCENCLTIMRGPVFDKTRRHATELRAYSAHRDQIMTYATIVIEPALKNLIALSDAIAHELGHNFGLLDCFTCKQKSTVMNQFKSMNVANAMDRPTACDIGQVRLAYKELATHVRPSPQTARLADEGEEPIDDDTPVVVPRP
jgi:hypothetical protein